MSPASGSPVYPDISYCVTNTKTCCNPKKDRNRTFKSIKHTAQHQRQQGNRYEYTLLSLALMPLAPKELSGLVVLIVAFEFGSQGLDMWAMQAGEIDISWIKRRILIPVALLSLVLGCVFYGFESAVPIFLWITTGLCICYTVANIRIYWRAACRTHNLFPKQDARQ